MARWTEDDLVRIETQEQRRMVQIENQKKSVNRLLGLLEDMRGQNDRLKGALAAAGVAPHTIAAIVAGTEGG